MAACQDCNESGSNKTLYPALAVAAIAGIALTYFFVAKKGKSGSGQLPVERVVNLCNSAADKLEAFARQAIAS